MTTIIETGNLTKRYRDFTALDHCDLSVDEGQAVGLLGPNGAGKTTLIRLLLGFLKPTTGGATIDGMDVYHDRELLHRRISYLPGETRSFGTMRAVDVISFFCGLRDDLTETDAKEMADRLELDLRRWVAFMSTGMKQKLGLAVALATRAPIVILDEPTTNLDPTVRGEVIDVIGELKRQGRTILVSSHVLSEVEDSCDEVVILDSGQIVHRQSLTELMQRHRIRGVHSGPLPTVPEHLQERVSVQIDGHHVEIEIGGELAEALEWLAGVGLRNVVIERMTLRQVYDEVLAGGRPVEVVR